jgi:hypothetical protein
MKEREEEPLSTEEVCEEMEVFEPYTTGELASYFDAPKQRIRNLLDRLAKTGKIRKKAPEPTRTIWIREAPVHECSNCGYKYEIKFVHPVFSAVQYCPQCGTHL